MAYVILISKREPSDQGVWVALLVHQKKFVYTNFVQCDRKGGGEGLGD